MLDFFLGHYAYWFTFILLVIGLYGMMMKKNLVKKLIGMTIFQVSVIIFYISGASKLGGTYQSPASYADADRHCCRGSHHRRRFCLSY